ncbi:hypothetical protein FKM82_015821 [Ascaphus truei]
MSNKAYLYVLRTIRHLQTCDSAVSTRIPKFTSRNHTSRANLLTGIAQTVNTYTPLLSATSSPTNTPVRFLSQEKEKNIKSGLEDQLSKDFPTVPVGSTQGVGSQIKEKSYSNVVDPLEEDESIVEQWGPSRTKEGGHNYMFSASLQKCTSPSDVLELYGKFSLNIKSVSNCFTTMWETIKRMGEEQRQYERQLMFEHPGFGLLCRQLMQEASNMTCKDLAFTLLSVVKLQVSQRTRLVQTLVRVCQEHLNGFEEKEMSVLASSLEVMESCTNVDALRSGLRLLVERRMPEIRGVRALQTMMRCTGKDAPISLKEKMEDKVLQMMDHFSLPNSQHMFSTLVAIDMRSLPILDACSQKIIDNMDGIPFWRLMHVLQSCKDLRYRNGALLTAIGDYVAGTMYMWQTKQVLLFLSHLESLGFRHPTLLDIFAEKVINSPDLLTLKDLLITVKVYSLLNHQPEGQGQQFLEALNSTLEMYLPRIPPTELLRVMYSFSILGYFPRLPLDKLLSEEVLNELLTSANQNVEVNERMLHYINLCLQLDKPSFTKPQVVVLGNRSTTKFTPHPEVQHTLLSILQDPSLLQENTQLANDYYIDFEIALDTEQNTAIPVVHTQTADDNPLHVLRVALLCAPVSSFCLGTLHARGKLAMKIRHIKVLGYHVVLVPQHEFEMLNESGRIEFLRSRIFSRETSPAQDINVAGFKMN